MPDEGPHHGHSVSPAEKPQSGESLPADMQVPDSEKAERVSAVRDFFTGLKKSLKTISLYRHNTAHYANYLENTFKILSDALERYENISLAVEQHAFKYLGESIYEAEANERNFAFNFYRDGIRLLAFRQGLTIQELLDFVLVCISDFGTSGAHGDMVSQLWKNDFDHIEYVVVESFSFGGESTEQTKLEVDKIVDYLYRRLTTKGEDSHPFARLSLDDLEIELEDVQQVSGVDIRDEVASEKEKKQVRDELENERRGPIFERLQDILLSVFEEEIDQPTGQALMDGFEQLFDWFLLSEDLASIDALFRRLKKLLEKNLPPESLVWAQQVAGKLRERMSSEQTIEKIGDILEAKADRDIYELSFRYLTGLGPDICPAVLRTLERLTNPDARRLLCEVLVNSGKDVPEVFAEKLVNPKANFVRDMLYILDKISPPDKLKHVSRLLAHPNLAIRIEAIKSIASSEDMAASAYMLRALRDKEPQVRITAASQLPNFDPGIAKRSLMEVVNSDEFAQRPEKEQGAFYAALSSLTDGEVMSFLRERLRSTTVLGKKKLADHKKVIISGIAQSGSIAAYRLLKGELESGNMEEDVAQAAIRTCNRLKDRLLGA